MKRNKGLGRGLDALLGGDSAVASTSPGTLPVARLRPGKYQPRTNMNTESLRELAESIKAQGVIQPVLVRKIESDDGDDYEIIAGERRVRAATIAGLQDVPVIIKQVPDNAALAIALIENIQREDLNPLEEAHGVARLIREFHFTHEQAAHAIGRSRSATSNLLRLINLAPPVQQMVLDGQLDMGHARALLALSAAQQIQLAHRIAAEQMSVRGAEALVARTGAAKAHKASKKAPARSRDIVRLEDELADLLGATIRLHADGRGKGSLTIQFSSLDQLDGLVARLRR